MRRASIIGVGVVFAGLIGHGAYWFYHAYHAKQWIDRFVTMVDNEEHVALTHQGIKVGGYPFSYDVTVLSPKVTIQDQGYTKIWEMDKLLLRSNLSMHHLTFYLPRSSDYKIAMPNGTQMHAHLASENRYPTLTLDLCDHFAGPFEHQLFVDWRRWTDYFESLHYVDHGYIMTDAVTKAVLATTEASHIDIVKHPLRILSDTKEDGSPMKPAYAYEYEIHYAVDGLYVPSFSMIVAHAMPGVALSTPSDSGSESSLDTTSTSKEPNNTAVVTHDPAHVSSDVSSSSPSMEEGEPKHTTAEPLVADITDVASSASSMAIPRLHAKLDARIVMEPFTDKNKHNTQLPIDSKQYQRISPSEHAHDVVAPEEGVVIPEKMLATLYIDHVGYRMDDMHIEGKGSFSVDFSEVPIPVGSIDMSVYPFEKVLHSLGAMGYVNHKQSVIDLWRSMDMNAEHQKAESLPPHDSAQLSTVPSDLSSEKQDVVGHDTVIIEKDVATDLSKNAQPLKHDTTHKQGAADQDLDKVTFRLSIDKQGHVMIGPFGLAEYLMRYYKAS